MLLNVLWPVIERDCGYQELHSDELCLVLYNGVSVIGFYPCRFPMCVYCLCSYVMLLVVNYGTQVISL